ncbi:TMV resistance protein N-like protein [Tanacetum coccineum]
MAAIHHVYSIKGLVRGGGKTSLARAIYDSLSIQFQGKSFVDNVREVSKGSLTGLKLLQEKVLLDWLNDQGINVSSVRNRKNMMKRRLCGRKNLIVLDDVNHIDQLKALAGAPDWFSAGSRIIIMTRDEHLLVSYGIEWIHNVKLLLDKEVIHLFSRHVFRREIPTQGFEELSKEVVSYAAGIPLIIEVLGSTLRGMKEFEWKDALERLKTIPLKEILENLESSYESLEEDYKEIFLDVACFLKGKPKDDAIRKLESCGFHARHGLRVLEQNSLINISEYGFLGMHDRIQDMGKYLVRSLHPNDPKRHSRLWKQEEIESIVAYDLGTDETKAVAVECPVKLSSEIVTKGFGSMKELKILCMVSEIVNDCDVKNDELTNNLVALEMPYSRIKCLWEGGERKVLDKLKFIDLNHTKLRTLDLGLIPNIETLNLTECHDLVELHLSVRCLKLRSLKISHSKLTTLNLGMTPNLELLELKNCLDFKELQMPLECLMLRNSYPIECPKLTSLKLRRSKLNIFDLRLTPNLEKLRLEECHELVELHIPIECLKLRSLNLGHSKLRTLDLRLTPNLEVLDLQDCYHLAELHTPIGCLKRLVFLNLSGCSKFNSFLFIKQLESLEVLCLTRLYLKEFPDVIPRHLDNSLLESRFRYNDIYELPSSIENLRRLVYLDFHSCRKPRILPGSICSLRNLRNLKLYGCKLEELPEDIGRLECLEKLNLSFTSIKHLPDSICKLKNLRTLNLSSCWNLEKLPEDIGRSESLQNLILTECTQVRDVPDSICMLKQLKYLSFMDCIQLQKLPEELGYLRCLEELNIKGTRIRFLPSSISLLTELKICGPNSDNRFYGIESTLRTKEPFSKRCKVGTDPMHLLMPTIRFPSDPANRRTILRSFKR